MSGRPTLFLVDDHAVVRTGTRKWLEDRFDIVGEADNVDSAIELITERRPDLVLLDVRLPGGGGAAVVGPVRDAVGDVVIVAYTAATSQGDVVAMMNAGVDGYLTKAATSEHDLPDLLDRAAAGGRPVSPDVAGYLLNIDDEIETGTGVDRLTAREREVVNRIAQGDTYREAAARLDMKVKTLETHMSHIFEKLGVASRYELTARYGRPFLHPDDAV